MAPSTTTLLLLFFLFLLLSSHSQPCPPLSSPSGDLFASCASLPALSSSLHFTFNSSNSTLSIAFSSSPSSPSGWISWAINPSSSGMLGAQALLAYPRPDGAALAVETLNINSYSTVVPSPILYATWGLSAEFSGGVMRLFGSVKLPPGVAEINQVWQVGPAIGDGGVPAKHAFAPENLNSRGTLDLVAGTTSGGGDDVMRERSTHGLLNAVSWGILLPIGAMIARFLKAFWPANAAWFHLHVACQLIGYSVGVVGWATGLHLGAMSKGIQYTTHRNIAIALFSLATLQVLALFLRPKENHKYRSCWNMYHHGVGYAVIVLGVINVFEGITILKPEDKWKHTYISVVVILALAALLLEIGSWILSGRRQIEKENKLYDASDELQNLPA